LLSGANQLQDITNDQNYSDLVGLTWDQIQAAFPTRLQQLADRTYEAVQHSKSNVKFKEAFGVTDETQTVASMSAEQRLQCLHIIMNDRYGYVPHFPSRLHSYVFHSYFESLSVSRFLLYSSRHLQIQRFSLFARVTCHIVVLLVRGDADSESG
jgi:hypothetical protein